MRRALLIAALLVGCGGKDEGGAAGGSGDKPAASEAFAPTLEAWKEGGLEASALTPATVDIGKACQTGTVKNLDVVLCELGSEDEAKAAEAKAWAWVGSTTGTAWVKEKIVVAVADRRKADPSGRTINQLRKLGEK